MIEARTVERLGYDKSQVIQDRWRVAGESTAKGRPHLSDEVRAET